MSSSGSMSAAMYERARALMPGGVNSPVRAGRMVGVDPPMLSRAAGPFVFDVDGRRYVDLVGSWGSAIVGHAHPQVVEAVQKAAADGLSFGACHPAEAKLAELIVGALPSIEMLRLVNSGTEATMSALRLCRAATKRDLIVKFEGCYHGHVDSLLVAAGSGSATLSIPVSGGVPSAFAGTTLLAPFNDVDAVEAVFERHGERIAGVIVEPVAGNMGMVVPGETFLQELRRVCDRFGALLIFDEVMTGFRVGWGGYQNICAVEPDITCLGKVIGGGMPVAAYGASTRMMSMVSPLGAVYQAGTLSGNPIGMAAGRATLELCRTPGFYELLDEASKLLVRRMREASAASGIPMQVAACGGMFGLFFSDSEVVNFEAAKASDHGRFAKFYRLMLERGVWLPPSGFEAMFLSAAHDADCLDQVVDAAAESLKLLD